MSTRRAAYTGDLNRFLFGSLSGVESTSSCARRSSPSSSRRCACCHTGAGGDDVRRDARQDASGLRPRLTHFALLALNRDHVRRLVLDGREPARVRVLVAPPAAAALLAAASP
jgi:hypothetical protein